MHQSFECERTHAVYSPDCRPMGVGAKDEEEAPIQSGHARPQCWLSLQYPVSIQVDDEREDDVGDDFLAHNERWMVDGWWDGEEDKVDEVESSFVCWTLQVSPSRSHVEAG